MAEALKMRLTLDTPNENGQTQREMWEQVLQSTPIESPFHQDAQAGLDAEFNTPVPACAEHILSWFWQLHEARQFGMDGPNPLSYTEIQSWMRTTRKIVHPYEVEIIKHLDSEFLRFSQKQKKKKNKK